MTLRAMTEIAALRFRRVPHSSPRKLVLRPAPGEEIACTRPLSWQLGLETLVQRHAPGLLYVQYVGMKLPMSGFVHNRACWACSPTSHRAKPARPGKRDERGP